MNYTVKAAARATGVSESRLRTWERRYGIPRPERSASGRREYSEADLSTIRRMVALVDAGLSAVDAAEAARSGEALVERQPITPVEDPLVMAMVRAAQAFDEKELRTTLDSGLMRLGWSALLDAVVFPALRQLGSQWEAASLPTANEHFASELVRRRLAVAIDGLPVAASDAPRLLLACPEGERHDLGLLALALMLRTEGFDVFYLGADVPTIDLIEVCRTTRPRAVCLSATSDSGLASLVRTSRMLVRDTAVPLFVGGPAVSGSEGAVAGITLPASVRTAAALIVQRLRSERVAHNDGRPGHLI